MESAFQNRGIKWSVIIPTLTGWPRLAESLPPLVASLDAGDEVIVVGDGCDITLEEPLASRCRVVTNPGPRGFATTCNRGADHARGRYLLFLNDDVVVAPGIWTVLGAALAKIGVAIVGPNLWSEYLGRSESGVELCFRRGVLDARQGSLTGSGLVEVPYVCGAALALTRDLFLKLGGFDEGLAPFFWEDVDLCLRARSQGASVVLAEVIVQHRHGVTIGREPLRHRRVIFERNRLLVTWRHLRRSQWPVHLLFTPIRLVAGMVRDWAVVRGFLQAVVMSLGGLR